MRRAAALAFWVPLGLADPSGAQEVDCASAVAQVELTLCAERDWMAADAELNIAYGAARDMARRIDAGLPAAERGAEAALREGQRAWVTFRDRTCEAEGYAFHGGSAEPMVIYGCRARLTRARTGDLRAMAGAT